MYLTREELHKSLIPGKTNVELIRGKNIGKKGLIVYKSMLDNSSYWSKHIEYTFHNYFSLILLINDKKVSTSCNNIKIIPSKL